MEFPTKGDGEGAEGAELLADGLQVRTPWWPQNAPDGVQVGSVRPRPSEPLRKIGDETYETNQRAHCRSHCRACGTHFSSDGAFDLHRTGPWGDRRCIEAGHDPRFAAKAENGICAAASVTAEEGVTVWTLACNLDRPENPYARPQRKDVRSHDR